MCYSIFGVDVRKGEPDTELGVGNFAEGYRDLTVTEGLTV